MLLQNYLSKNKGFCILGTDTGIGKTYVTCQLLNYFNDQHYKTLGVKPIASGGIWKNHQLCNEDALDLQAHSSLEVSYDIINPIIFEKPVSPHIAAMAVNKKITVKHTLKACEETFKQTADIFLIEGCGGILTPINEQETFLDVVCQLGFPAILVVGMRLGCLNHAKLTCTYLTSMSIPTIGFIANFFDPDFLEPEENLKTLERTLGIPLLGTVGFQEKLIISENV